MNEEQVEQIESLLQPLKDELGPYLKAVWIYGSATRKDRVEGSDIDILVLVDDTRKGFDEQIYNQAKQLLKQIEDDAELDLHFQPPKPLSKWWDLLISGEPWAVTSMKDAQTIYDPSDYIALTQKLLLEGEMHGTHERAQELLKRSREKLAKMETLLMEDVTSELLRAMTESAQAVLMYYGDPPPSPDQIGDELETNFVEDDMLSQRAVQDYQDFYRLTERIDHGTLTEFTGQELDRYLNQAMAFIRAMATLFDKIEHEKQENIITESHNEAIELCKEALDEHGVEVPTDDEAVLQQFRETFIEEGHVSEEYWELLQQIENKKDKLEDGKLDEMSEQEIYSSRVHVRDFESAINNVLSREAQPAMLEDREDDEDSSGVDIVKEYADRLLEEHEDDIKAIWLLSVDEIEESNDFTLIILYNDLQENTDAKQAIREQASAVSEQVTQEQGINIHPTFYDLSDYWNLVRHGSPITFSEIRQGIPIYDPSGFFLPLKKLLSQGKIPGTKEAMRSLIAKAPKRVAKVKKQYKGQILEQMYNAVVDSGQAALIANGVAPPVQKQLPDTLRQHLGEDGTMAERDIERCESVIQHWKDYEHGEIEDISGEDLDTFMDDTRKFIEAAEEIMENSINQDNV